MAMGKIEVTQFQLTGRAAANEPVRKNDFIAEFNITVENTGCYIIDVALIEDDLPPVYLFLNYDDEVATNRGNFTAYCLEQNKSYPFWITANDSSLPAGNEFKPGNSKAKELTPLVGKWPTEEIGNTLNVRLEIKVYLIERVPSCSNHVCKTVGGTEINTDDPIAEISTNEKPVKLSPQTDPYESVLKGLEKLGPAASGALKTALYSESFEDVDRKLLILAEEVKALKKSRRS